MNHPPLRTNLPRNCTFDPGDWRILARSWFPVAIAAQAAAGPIGAVPLDQPLVVYRTGMSFIVADDQGVPLTMGFQDGDLIRCAYHGLRFGAEGKCDHVPASPDMRIPDRLH
jgi:phenylpropionate dioxygenase-like ring-hydroxylating dioxygenase large terminal subunit